MQLSHQALACTGDTQPCHASQSSLNRQAEVQDITGHGSSDLGTAQLQSHKAQARVVGETAVLLESG